MNSTASKQEVEFLLLSEESAMRVSGHLIVRNGEMVLDLTDEDDYQYLFVARQNKDGAYFAEASTPASKPSRARAAWEKLGPSYVGRWLEYGEEYLFTFRVQRTS